jgi:hypothetical protein
VTFRTRLVAGLRGALDPDPEPSTPEVAQPEHEDGSDDKFERVVQLVGSVVAPVTLITALMFYVGWVRSNALFQRFGIDAALLKFSNQDYLLRSVDSLWLPVGLLLLVGLGGAWVYRAVRAKVEQGKDSGRVHRTAVLTTAAGVLMSVLGLVEVVLPGVVPLYTLIFPIALGIGVTAVYFGVWLLRCATAMKSPAPVVAPAHSAVPVTLTFLLVVLSLFWASGEYARAVGRGMAADIAADPFSRPAVMIYSEKRLYLGGGLEVAEEILPDDPTARYRYRYSRLRLLTASSDRLFLIPESWAGGGRNAVVLVLDGSVRMEASPSELR